MKVMAIEKGFYNGKMVKPMTVFEFHGEKLGNWMVPADGEKIETKEETKEETDGPTRKEIMAQLEQAGVAFKPNMNKAELLELLRTTIEKYAPGSSTAGKDITERINEVA